MEIKAVIGLLLLIVPGYLAGELKNHLRYVYPPAQFDKTVQAIIFSVLAYISLLLLDGLLLSSNLLSTGWYGAWNKLLGGNVADLSVITSPPLMISYAVVLLLAVVEGTIAAYVLNTWWDRLVTRISHRNHYQRVWDELFVRKDIKPPLYVSLLMKDGMTYHGVVDRSSDVAGEKELLLREIYRSRKDDELMQKPEIVAAPFVYISESNIQALFVLSQLEEQAVNKDSEGPMSWKTREEVYNAVTRIKEVVEQTGGLPDSLYKESIEACNTSAIDMVDRFFEGLLVECPGILKIVWFKKQA